MMTNTRAWHEARATLFIALALMAILSLFSPAHAAEAAEFALEPLLIAVFGASPVFAWIGLALLAWTHIRPHIPSQWLAKLPIWLIKVLDWLAGNYRKTKNDLAGDAVFAKQIQKAAGSSPNSFNGDI